MYLTRFERETINDYIKLSDYVGKEQLYCLICAIS